jgi:hypothetical protein
MAKFPADFQLAEKSDHGFCHHRWDSALCQESKPLQLYPKMKTGAIKIRKEYRKLPHLFRKYKQFN